MAKAESPRRSDASRARASQKRAAQRARILQEVVADLERDRGTRAAKLCRNGQDHGLFPTGNGLRRWLLKSIGKEATGKLVDAFARFPCFYCENGLETCETCNGRGTIADSLICEVCAGLSVTRCGFCDGSGFVTNNVVPPGLRVVVLAERVNRASSRIKTLLDKPVPQDAPTDPVGVAKRCAKQLLDLSRQMGVFENTVVAAKDLAQAHPRSKEKLAKIVGLCCHAAVDARQRIRELAEQMSRCSKLQAEAPDVDESVRRRAERGAEFYESLAASETLAGTALEHPYLQRAVARLSRSGSRKNRPSRKRSSGEQ
jgi:hypothetical protein